ncbi:MAG TPA: universal stress protein [Stellaceae bacterium]|jgi:nucleotide-binding universal stress UspA family protein
MIKTILVPATGSAADAAVFASALSVARRFDAHLDFLHVRVDATTVATTMASDGGGAAMVGGLVERLDEEVSRREQRARRLFEQFCEREGLVISNSPPQGSMARPRGPSAQWTMRIGAEAYCVAEHGRATDLMVIGRSEDGEGVAPETIEAALLDSGRPVLIPGAAPMAALPQTVVIAWKATREAAHAVTAALPFLDVAKHVEVLTVAEEPDLSSEEGSQLIANLRWRGLSVSGGRLQPDGRSPADTLLAAAAERRALLVMGGYGHSRLREWIFGGFTQHVLQTPSASPVLIAH